MQKSLKNHSNYLQTKWRCSTANQTTTTGTKFDVTSPACLFFHVYARLLKWIKRRSHSTFSTIPSTSGTQNFLAHLPIPQLPFFILRRQTFFQSRSRSTRTMQRTFRVYKASRCKNRNCFLLCQVKGRSRVVFRRAIKTLGRKHLCEGFLLCS